MTKDGLVNMLSREFPSYVFAVREDLEKRYYPPHTLLGRIKQVFVPPRMEKPIGVVELAVLSGHEVAAAEREEIRFLVEGIRPAGVAVELRFFYTPNLP